jgi:hypothetical protein
MTALKALVLAFALLSFGCHSITIKSGRDVSPRPSRVDGKTFNSILGDVVVVDKPVDLAWACPSGWSEIHTEVTPFDWLVTLLGFGVYQAHNVTVKCAPGAAN